MKGEPEIGHVSVIDVVEKEPPHDNRLILLCDTESVLLDSLGIDVYGLPDGLLFWLGTENQLPCLSLGIERDDPSVTVVHWQDSDDLMRRFIPDSDEARIILLAIEEMVNSIGLLFPSDRDTLTSVDELDELVRRQSRPLIKSLYAMRAERCPLHTLTSRD